MSTPADFMPIPIHEFVNGITIPVDLYIRLSEEKFVLVGKSGSHNSIDQFKNYQNKEVAYLWVLKKEYYKITHQTISIAGIGLSKKDLDDKVKTTLISHAARSVFRQMDGLGLDMESYNNSKMVCEAVMGLVDTHKSLADLLASFKSYSDQLLSHSIAVSTIAVLLGQAMGYEKKATLEKLSLGGLLHDVGLKSLPQDLTKKSLAEMTPDEVQLWETHPYRGMQMLQSLGIVPDDIVSIVYEHHENSIGQGFPQRIRDVKIHPLAKIVCLADAYVDLILPNPNCPEPKNPREALMYIEHTLGIPYNKEAFRALKKVIEADKKAA
ncbi:MAG: HD-GYP domain-containing protein [Bdellovibrionales bacterium]